MRYKPILLALALTGAFAIGAIGQTVIQSDLSGNEAWNAGQGPGGPSTGFLSTNLIRNSMAKVVTQPGGTVTMGAGTLAALRYGGNILVPTQPVLTTTIVAPPNPVQDGAIISTCNVSGAAFATTNIAMTANTGQVFNTAASTPTLAALTCIYYQFNRANLVWYRIQ